MIRSIFLAFDSPRSSSRQTSRLLRSWSRGYHLKGILISSTSYCLLASSRVKPLTWASAPPLKNGIWAAQTAIVRTGPASREESSLALSSVSRPLGIASFFGLGGPAGGDGLIEALDLLKKPEVDLPLVVQDGLEDQAQLQDKALSKPLHEKARDPVAVGAVEMKPPFQNFCAQGVELVFLDPAPDFLDFSQDLFAGHSFLPGQVILPIIIIPFCQSQLGAVRLDRTPPPCSCIISLRFSARRDYKRAPDGCRKNLRPTCRGVHPAAVPGALKKGGGLR